MKTWTDLLTEARVGLAAAPDPSVAAALRRAAQRFFRETHIWQEKLEPVALEAGEAEYSVELPPGARIERLKVAKLNGSVYDVGLMRYADLFELPSDTGPIQAVALSPAADQLVVWRTPDEAQAGAVLELLVVLAPTIASRGLPDHLADEWHDGLVAGARAEMFANKDMPWFSLELASHSEMIYADVVARARREQHSGHHNNLKVRPRPLA